MLSDVNDLGIRVDLDLAGLNAPYGARCFLTREEKVVNQEKMHMS